MMRRSELNPGGCEFLGMGDCADLAALEVLLQQGMPQPLSMPQQQSSSGESDTQRAPNSKVAAIFTEFPSNPLMKCPDLVR